MITAIRLLTELRQDVRYGLRTLASSPGFTAVAVISLALGIGVATCAFSEMNGFVLRDVPGVSKPGELVTLQPPSSYPNYQRYRQRNDLFSGALAYLAPVPFGISLGWRTERTWGHLVAPSYFATLGVRPALGRVFDEGEEQAGRAPSVVVSYRFSLGRRIDIGNEEVPTFQAGGLPGIGPRALGRTRVLQVVGVAKNVRDGLDLVPADAPALIYLPLRPVDSAQPVLQGVTLVVRAAPGVDAILALRREILHLDEHLTPFNARSMPEQIEQMMFPVKVALWTYGFIGIFGLILASVGLAGLTAYSVTQRRREIGIRMALGARSADVLGLVMKESAVLIAAGTVVGLAGAAAGIRLLSAFMSVIARTAGTSASDPALLVGAPLLLAILALVACYVPARSSMRVDPVVILRQD